MQFTLLELDDGTNKDVTDSLTDRVNTLKDTIQAQQDFEDQEAARKYYNIKDFYSSLYSKRDADPNLDEVLEAVGPQNIKTLNSQELGNTEK